MLFNPYPKFQISKLFSQGTWPTVPNFKSFSPKVLDQYDKYQVLFFQRTLPTMPNFKKGTWPVCQMSSPFFPTYPAGTSNELDVQNGWEENTHTHTHTLPTMPNFKSFSSKVLDQYAKFQVLFSQRTWPTMPNFKSFSPKELDQYAKFRVLFLETFFLLHQYAEFQLIFFKPSFCSPCFLQSFPPPMLLKFQVIF